MPPLPLPSLRDVSAYISTAARAGTDSPEARTAASLLRRWESEFDGIAWRSEAIVRVLQSSAPPARENPTAPAPAAPATAWWVTAARLVGEAPELVERFRAAFAPPLARPEFPPLPARRWRIEPMDAPGEGRLLVRYNAGELASERQAALLGEALTARLVARIRGSQAGQG